MPDTCTECFKHNKCDGYHIEILKNEDGDYIPQYIAHNCPLVEVKTPHGRLIDADKIYHGWEMVVYDSDFEKAPTVIEAEVE